MAAGVSTGWGDGEALRCDIVCEGGGVKALGLAGAFSTLEERGYRLQRIAGSSFGSVPAALLAAGYRSEEVKTLLLSFDFHRVMDRSLLWRVPVVGPLLSLLFKQGIYQGRYFHEWLRQLLAQKGVRTFADLSTGDTHAAWRHRLQVLVSDLSTQQVLVLPRDAEQLGIEADELEVAAAVRMSMGVPLFFEPVRWRNARTGQEHLLVDGGILSDFPVWLFDCQESERPSWPTFGLLLVEPTQERSSGERMLARHGRGGKAFFRNLLRATIRVHGRIYLESAQLARTICIESLGVSTTDFGLSRERAQSLYVSGRRAAERFLDLWDFAAYVNTYRSPLSGLSACAVDQQVERPLPGPLSDHVVNRQLGYTFLHAALFGQKRAPI